MNQLQKQRKSSQATLDRVKAWAAANPERRREIALKSYLKLRPELKPVLTPIQRFEKLYTPEPSSGCWLWLGAVNKDGYGKVKVERKHLTAHRWSWVLHFGEIQKGAHVLHRCDVPGCVNPAHLFIGSNDDNVADREAKGRSHKMPIHRETKLTDSDVVAIRNLRGKETCVSVGKKFGIHYSRVSRIQRGKCFSNVPME